ncbi:MAG: YfhO family protein [Acidobacteriales bacterium]|nr:YfhO family protein [Terriglobales bacterium]
MAGAKRKKTRRVESRVTQPTLFWKPNPCWIAFAGFAVAVLVFYWNPLTNANTTPQWDTIDYHYSVQKFASDELKSFRLPHWSEFSYSGFPFLADPQVGIWYPLNWPFLLAGITPRALQWEIALHVLLGLMGTWLLAGLWLPSPWYAAIAAVLYGFSGFFAGHASHLGMLQTAAWMPLLLYGLHRSIRSGSRTAMGLTGVGCALMMLAGHFQSALYTFAALGVYGAVAAGIEKKWRAAIAALVVCAVLAVLLSAVQWLPTMELAGQSTRAGMKFETTNAPLELRALWTLFSPDHYGSVSGNYSGPEDRTQFYFYAGVALLPLALLGSLFGRLRWAALALVLPFAWYAFGPSAGLYRVTVHLPGFGAVRAPVHAWFVVALGLALLGAAGAAVVSEKVKLPWLAVALAIFTFCDVLYWNSMENQLAYYRGSFESRYGIFQDNFERAVRRQLPEGTRFFSPFASPTFGPLNDAYDTRIPVTYGSNPLQLKRYTEYINAAAGNLNLLNALNVGLRVNENGTAVVNADMLPKFFFPKRLTAVSARQSRLALASANPAENALVEGEIDGLAQDPEAKVTVLTADDQHYVLQCETATPSLLRAAIPWYPGWQAFVDGRPVTNRVVDYALIGIPVPAGSHRIVLEFHDSKFQLGAAITLLSACFLLGAAVWARRTHSSNSSSASATT